MNVRHPFVSKMPKRRKTKYFLEDIGSFEFDELSISLTSRLVDESKCLGVDFSGFLRCSIEDVSVGTSIDAQSKTHDVDGHCGKIQAFLKMNQKEKAYCRPT